MKLDFPWTDDAAQHDYCIHCHAETVKKVVTDNRQFFDCRTCGQRSDRAITIDPKLSWSIGRDKEILHESAGAFIKAPDNTFLVFDLMKFPFQTTVPAGHIDAGEAPENAAQREAQEETGLQNGTVIEIGTEVIPGDSCSRGSDNHRWHIYVIKLPNKPTVTINDEGNNPRWVTIDQALETNITVPVRRIFTAYKAALSDA